MERKTQLNIDDEEGEVEMDMFHSEDWYDDFAREEGKNKRYKTRIHEIISASMDNNIHAYGKTLEEKYEILKGLDIQNVVLENVLPLLPAKVLTRFRTVSKHWDSWIQGHILSHRQSYSYLRTSGFFCQPRDLSPTFLSLSPTAHGVPQPSLGFLPGLGRVHIVASSHGLIVCQSQDGNNTYYVCNPANQTWRQLPKPEYYHGPDAAHVLVLEPRLQNIEGHYHLVCACSMVGQAVLCFEVYSSETNSWRCSDAMCLDFEGVRFAGPGFHMKGVSYWVTSMMQILAFDLKNDVYEIIPLPTKCSPHGALTRFNGQLCYASVSNTNNDFYVMKLYYGVGLSLTLETDLELEQDPTGAQGLCRVLPCFEEDRLMILFAGMLYSFSLVDGKIAVVRSGVWHTSTMDADAKFVPYVNSLFRVM